MFVFSTPEQVLTLKQRSIDWEKDGFPGIDAGLQLSMLILNKFPHLTPVYSCTGHIKQNPETKRFIRSDFYVVFAATEAGFNILRDIYQRLQDRLIARYTERHNHYKELVKQHEHDEESSVPNDYLRDHPVSRPNLLRLTHTVRIWPISTAGGNEGLHDGDTNFYNVALLAAETGNASKVIGDFLNDFTEVVMEVAELFGVWSKERLEELTPADIKEAADRVGLPLVSVYSGKLLSDVPCDEIWIGMELISARGVPGKVRVKLDKKDHPNRENENYIVVDWENGNSSHDWHFNFSKVKVK